MFLELHWGNFARRNKICSKSKCSVGYWIGKNAAATPQSGQAQTVPISLKANQSLFSQKVIESSWSNFEKHAFDASKGNIGFGWRWHQRKSIEKLHFQAPAHAPWAGRKESPALSGNGLAAFFPLFEALLVLTFLDPLPLPLDFWAVVAISNRLACNSGAAVTISIKYWVLQKMSISNLETRSPIFLFPTWLWSVLKLPKHTTLTPAGTTKQYAMKREPSISLAPALSSELQRRHLGPVAHQATTTTQHLTRPKPGGGDKQLAPWFQG